MAAIMRPGEAPMQTARESVSFWPWVLQRISGLFLVVLMGIHIGINHFGNLGKASDTRDLIIFNDVAFRLQQGFWWAVDVALLTFVVYHGLNGIRNIALDLGVRGTGTKVTTGLLWLLGIATWGFGIAALIAFRKYA